MKKLLFRYWFRKQKFLEEYPMFVVFVYIMGILLFPVCIVCILWTCSLDNLMEKIIALNMLGIFFTFYNLPTIILELKETKAKALLHMENKAWFFAYCFLKRNLIIIPYVCAMFFCFAYSLYTEPVNSLLLILTLLLQFIMVGIGISSIRGKKFFAVGVKFSRISNSYILYIIKYLMRIRKREYLNMVFAIAVGLAILKISGNRKVLSLYFILFFMAKIQLLIESKQNNYNTTYSRNAFLDILDVGSHKKIIYSAEFKVFILDLMAIFLCYSIQLISYGFDDLILVQTVNTGLLMYLYLDKILKVFYYRIHDGAYFKGTFTNLFFLYLFFFLLSIDLLINKSIWAALLTSIVIVLLILFRIEKIFYKNIFDKRSRKCRLLI